MNKNLKIYYIKQQLIKGLTKIYILKPKEMFFFLKWTSFFFFFYKLFSINLLDFILIVSLNINNQKHL